MAVNKERVQLGVDALRSGEFPQGRGALKFNGSYCCLGVFCEVAIRNGLEVKVTQQPGLPGKFRFDDVGDFLPFSVQEWYGFSERDPHLSAGGSGSCGCGCSDQNTATIANDELKWSFLQIADAFEEMYLKEDGNG